MASTFNPSIRRGGAAGPGASLTVPYRSNNRGQVVGAYVVPDGTPGGRTHGFVLDKGKVRTLDGPGGAPT